MKDFVQIFNRVSSQRCSGANIDRELRELTNNRLKCNDIDKSRHGSIAVECDGHSMFEDIDFGEKRNAIINRLFERRRQGQLTRQPKCKCCFCFTF